LTKNKKPKKPTFWTFEVFKTKNLKKTPFFGAIFQPCYRQDLLAMSMRVPSST